MIKEHEAGMPTAELCRMHGLSPASFCKFKSKYVGMNVSETHRLKSPEDDNARLKRLLADTMLDNVVLKELPTPVQHWTAALKAMRDHDVSQRRVCRLAGVDPKTVRRDRLPDTPEVREEMQTIASRRRRFGVLLERKGMFINHKKLYRLYTEEKPGVRRRRGRKCATRITIACARGFASVGLWILYPTRLARHASSVCWQ